MDIFQKCPIIHQKFRKKYNPKEDKDFLIELLEDNNIINFVGQKICSQIENALGKEKLEIKSSETNYFFQLLL